VRIFKVISGKFTLIRTTTSDTGRGTWSLALREEHRLKVFENKVLRIFGPKRYNGRKLEKIA
jgi:hypothetical protein